MRDRLQQLIRFHSRRVIAAFVALAALAGIAATGIRIDPGVERLMIANDPLRELDELAKEDFGNDEILLVALDVGRAYDASDLRKLASISARIAELSGVEKIHDLSNTEDVRGDGDDLDASALIEFDRIEEELADIQSRTREHRLYERILISEDQSAFGLLVYPRKHDDDPDALNRMTEAVKAIVAEQAPPWDFHFAGYPYTAYEVNRIIKRDLALLTPIALFAIGAILYFVTRRLFPLILLLVLIGWSEVVAHGFLALVDAPLNAVVSATPTILMATSATYLIYTIGMMGRVSRNPDPGAALIPLLYRPVMLSALSTAIGFLSLRLIDVEAIGDLGSGLAVGIVAAAAGTLLLLPAIVQAFDLRIWPRHLIALEHWSLIGVRLAKRPWPVVAVTLLLLAVALPGALRVVVHTDTLSYFAADSPVRTGAEFFERKLSSGFLLNVVVRGQGDGRALDPELLSTADAIVDRLDGHANVDRTISLLDYFHLIDGALRPEAPNTALPDSRNMAAQYLLLYEASGDPADYEPYVNHDRSALAILVPMHGGSAVYIDAAREIEGAVGPLPDDVSVETLGSTYLYSRAMDGLTRGILYGLLTAMILIGIVMLIGLRSISLACVAAIPNVTPLLLCAGAIGWLDIPLAMGTSVVGCITLGLAVDDTSHVLGHLRRDRTLAQNYVVVGPPVILTTLALGLGFSTLMLSEFQSVVALGMATSVTLIVALAADVLLLPSLLALIGYEVGGTRVVPEALSDETFEEIAA